MTAQRSCTCPSSASQAVRTALTKARPPCFYTFHSESRSCPADHGCGQGFRRGPVAESRVHEDRRRVLAPNGRPSARPRQAGPEFAQSRTGASGREPRVVGCVSLVRLHRNGEQKKAAASSRTGPESDSYVGPEEDLGGVRRGRTEAGSARRLSRFNSAPGLTAHPHPPLDRTFELDYYSHSSARPRFSLACTTRAVSTTALNFEDGRHVRPAPVRRAV